MSLFDTERRSEKSVYKSSNSSQKFLLEYINSFSDVYMYIFYVYENYSNASKFMKK